MKKLILIIALLLMTSCVSQNIETQPPVDVVITMRLTQVNDTTATFVSKYFDRIFEVDAKPDMLRGQEYKVRVIFPRHSFNDPVIQAKLVDYSISPAQAARNAGAMQKGSKL